MGVGVWDMLLEGQSICSGRGREGVARPPKWPEGPPTGGRRPPEAFHSYFWGQIHGFEFFLRSRIFLDAFNGFPTCSRESLIFFRFLGFFYIFLRTARPKNAKTPEIFFAIGRKTEYTGSELSTSWSFLLFTIIFQNAYFGLWRPWNPIWARRNHYF